MILQLLAPVPALVLWALVLWTAPAAAEVRRDAVLTRVTAADLMDLLQSWGYQPTLLPPVTDTQRIGIEMKAAKVYLLLYDCDSAAKPACATLQFYAGFDTKDQVTLIKVNDWNLNQRWGRAYLDPEAGVAAIDMDVNLSKGVTPANVQDTLGTFGDSLAAFKTFIGF